MTTAFMAEAALVSMPGNAPLSPEALHAHFLEILPRVETHARIYFRHVRCPGRRADAIAETVAVAWQWFLRAAERGKDVRGFAAALASLAARHVRSGRRLCGQEKAGDAMSPLAQRRNGFGVEALASVRRCHQTSYSDPHGQERMDAVEERLKDNTRSPVPEQAAFRIDFPRWHRTRWHRTRRHRDRRIIDGMARDERTLDLSEEFGISPGRISQLRREFHDDWRCFHGEYDEAGAALA